MSYLVIEGNQVKNATLTCFKPEHTMGLICLQEELCQSDLQVLGHLPASLLSKSLSRGSLPASWCVWVLSNIFPFWMIEVTVLILTFMIPTKCSYFCASRQPLFFSNVCFVLWHTEYRQLKYQWRGSVKDSMCLSSVLRMMGEAVIRFVHTLLVIIF